MTTFGISVGTTLTGCCILKDGILLDRQVHEFRDQWSNKKLRAITNRYRQYVTKHNPTAIVAKVPPSSSHTPPIKRVISRVEALAKEYGCQFDLIIKTELKDFTGMRSTGELIEYTRRLYPSELSELHRKGVASGHGYYAKLYEAVLSTHVYHHKHQERG